MKKLIMLITALTLTACASVSQDDLINLTPSSTLSSSKVVDGLTFTLTSQDVRNAQFIAIIKDGDKNKFSLFMRNKMYVKLMKRPFISNSSLKALPLLKTAIISLTYKSLMPLLPLIKNRSNTLSMER